MASPGVLSLWAFSSVTSSAGRSIQRVPALVLGAVNSPVMLLRRLRTTTRPDAQSIGPLETEQFRVADSGEEQVTSMRK